MENVGMIAVDSEEGKELGFTSDKWRRDASWLWKQGTNMYFSMLMGTQQGKGNLSGLMRKVEEIAEEYGIKTDIKEPKQNQWDAEYGFKQRNIDIAKSDIVHVILVRDYPPNYKGRTFTGCYHCLKHPSVGCGHIKSGGCWTGWKAKEFGNKVRFYIIMDEFQVMEYWGI